MVGAAEAAREVMVLRVTPGHLEIRGRMGTPGLQETMVQVQEPEGREILVVLELTAAQALQAIQEQALGMVALEARAARAQTEMLATLEGPVVWGPVATSATPPSF